jgi:hypothetical protein
MEMKMLSTDVKFLSNFDDVYNCKAMDCSTSGGGKSGGIMMLWNSLTIDVDIINCDFNYIDSI